jgi:hypothetical protein
MPGSMDGLELARTIEANFDGVTVILTSGTAPSQLSPARTIIAKPYNLADVANQIISDVIGPRHLAKH